MPSMHWVLHLHGADGQNMMPRMVDRRNDLHAHSPQVAWGCGRWRCHLPRGVRPQTGSSSVWAQAQLAQHFDWFGHPCRVQGGVPLVLSGFHVYNAAVLSGAACWSAVWVGGVCRAKPGALAHNSLCPPALRSSFLDLHAGSPCLMLFQLQASVAPKPGALCLQERSSAAPLPLMSDCFGCPGGTSGECLRYLNCFSVAPSVVVLLGMEQRE